MDTPEREIQKSEPCNVCGCLVAQPYHAIIVKEGARIVCQSCTMVACDNCECYECNKPSRFVFSYKMIIGTHSKDDKPNLKSNVTFYFPCCSKDCMTISHPRGTKFVEDMLPKEKPVVHMNICKHCSRTKERMPLCHNCKSSWYCDRVCQLADWPVHKVFCQHPANKSLP